MSDHQEGGHFIFEMANKMHTLYLRNVPKFHKIIFNKEKEMVLAKVEYGQVRKQHFREMLERVWNRHSTPSKGYSLKFSLLLNVKTNDQRVMNALMSMLRAGKK